MTSEQVENLNLGIYPIDERTVLLVESGLQWVLDNTTLEFDFNNDSDLEALQPCVKLFVVKYIDLMLLTGGVASESIEGLSQSYNSSDIDSNLWNYARALLGKYLKPNCSFIQASNRWQ